MNSGATEREQARRTYEARVSEFARDRQNTERVALLRKELSRYGEGDAARVIRLEIIQREEAARRLSSGRSGAGDGRLAIFPYAPTDIPSERSELEAWRDRMLDAGVPRSVAEVMANLRDPPPKPGEYIVWMVRLRRELEGQVRASPHERPEDQVKIFLKPDFVRRLEEIRAETLESSRRQGELGWN